MKTLIAMIVGFTLTMALSYTVLGQTSTPTPTPQQTEKVVPTGAPSTGFGF